MIASIIAKTMKVFNGLYAILVILVIFFVNLRKRQRVTVD
ncbi:Hypothetical protein LOCK908_0913 [Lacticaseibacillus rhamnosus LOCK908]|uniref:Uncharacterized protein n=1 Tax=Lacticaseibacillus rhamnosus (strain LMS2-1) TaxID=525361 RepID=C2JVL8_LACRM|nr:conserved hypothetical protein [Lacticaseibacillus rhamnosus ATCC 8530]AGP73559.1 Hypothetical protein LOCK908_0913 [Lacticaseibacillus rhamnosus LOCK908]ASY49721.1 hypothetical protein N507_2583 [Lacticaseibacillus rhamnosus DSM 14870]EEN80918.1 hypothetical protein HMPREF0539_0952 [Lacticaseibacillus rhamnosus LMS2-1]